MTTQKKFSVKSLQQGTVIVETLVAILIFSVGVLGIVGMQGNMVKHTAESKYRADASNIARATIGTMWSDMANLNNYVKTDAISSLPGGYRTVTRDNVIADNNGNVIGGVFTITINWQAPGESAHTFSTITYIAG